MNVLKTTTISITNMATRSILGIIRQNNLAFVCLGIDQNDQLIMQISYTEQQQGLISIMHHCMQEAEAMQRAVDTLLDITFKEQDERLRQLRLKFRRRHPIQDKSENESSQNKQTEHGNDKQS